jgi:hypothetical protein
MSDNSNNEYIEEELVDDEALTSIDEEDFEVDDEEIEEIFDELDDEDVEEDEEELEEDYEMTDAERGLQIAKLHTILKELEVSDEDIAEALEEAKTMGYKRMTSNMEQLMASLHDKMAAEGVIDPKSEEDPDLYQTADGKHAKLDTKKTKGKAVAPTTKPSQAGVDKKVVVPAEAVEEIFGEDLTEEMKNKTATLFEAAVNEKINEFRSELLEDHVKSLSEHMHGLTTELTDKVDEYLSYVIEKWVDENELAIETGIRTEVAENFILGLKNLFLESAIQVPEEKTDLVEELASEVTSLSEEMNSLIEENISLKKENLLTECDNIFHEVANGLADTQVERLSSLTEGIEFEHASQYREKVEIIKETYFGDKSKKATLLEENLETTSDEESQEELSSSMSVYANAIARTLPKS